LAAEAERIRRFGILVLVRDRQLDAIDRKGRFLRVFFVAEAEFIDVLVLHHQLEAGVGEPADGQQLSQGQKDLELTVLAALFVDVVLGGRGQFFAETAELANQRNVLVGARVGTKRDGAYRIYAKLYAAGDARTGSVMI
jgi:hypothetical protein